VNSATAALAVAVFCASAVETVEAVTIVLAAGVTRGFRSALQGAVAALAVLAVLVAVLGPLVVRAPLSGLRIVIGGILLLYGMQWMRKAILRAGGAMAKRDEDAIFEREVARLGSTGSPDRRVRDRVGFAVAFKGVFLEGFEVVVIIITLGTSGRDLGVAVLAGLAAVVLVGSIGAVLSRQLSKVPENSLKMLVGILLVSFGTFWSGEGLGVRWPGSDVAILVLVAIYGALAFLLTAVVARSGRRTVVADAS
jgi:Ca2+/H+ antiporter, TMEM165/GDT1 family